MNIGTIGSGQIVDAFLSAIQLVDNATCTAMYSRSLEKAKDFAKKHGVMNAYADLDEFLSQTNIDIVYIASPNSVHFKQARMALLANKHVICEKPFTTTVAELEELISLAASRGLFLFEAITTIHMPNYHLVKNAISSIGDVKFVQCNYSQYSKKYNLLMSGEMPNVFNPEFSGGALMDINVYNLHFAIGLFGLPLKSDYYANIYSNGIDTSGVMVLTYDDFLCTCVGCKDSRSMNFAMIQGTKGYIHIINGANGCERIEVINGTNTYTLNAQTTTEKLSYEISRFIKLITDGDFVSCSELLNHSLDVQRVIADSRQRAGVIFSDDCRGK